MTVRSSCTVSRQSSSIMLRPLAASKEAVGSSARIKSGSLARARERHALTLTGTEVVGVSVPLVGQANRLQEHRRAFADQSRRMPRNISGTPTFSPAVKPRIR